MRSQRAMPKSALKLDLWIYVVCELALEKLLILILPSITVTVLSHQYESFVIV